MSNLYIRLPSRASVTNVTLAQDSAALPFARTSAAGAVLQEGIVRLSHLTNQLKQVKRVVLLLAASDVAILRVATPPLSPANLRKALPHLVEDQLMTDPAECVMVAGATVEGWRSVAIIQRDWLTDWIQTIIKMGAPQIHEIRALPAQFCLPYSDHMASVSVTEQNAGVEITARLSTQQGVGLSVAPDQNIPLAQEVLQLVRSLVSTDAVTVYVAPDRISDYRTAAQSMEKIHIAPDHWPQWVKGARATDALALNLAVGFTLNKGIRWGQNTARWLRWVVIIVMIHVLGLNLDRWRLEHEANTLRHAMTDLFLAAFPKEKVIIDPLLQARQKVASLKQDAGQTSPEEFTSLAGQVNQAWAGTKNGLEPEIASLEYRNHGMFIHIKSNRSIDSVWLDQFKTELRTRHLAWTIQEAGVWHIQIAP